MVEQERNWQEALKLFRERTGGMTEAKKSWSKDQRGIRKSIQEALKGGPLTIPEVAGQTGLPSDKVLWYVLAMKRYGEVAEANRAGDYFRYRLKEKPK